MAVGETWIRNRIRKYASQVGLGYVPRVIFAPRAWVKAVPKSQHGAIEGNTAGVAYDGIIFINKEHVCCRKSADDLAAHEVLHLARPSWRHGKRFTEAVEQIRLGRTPE